jgi:hypothetical protein
VALVRSSSYARWTFSSVPFTGAGVVTVEAMRGVNAVPASRSSPSATGAGVVPSVEVSLGDGLAVSAEGAPTVQPDTVRRIASAIPILPMLRDRET